MWRPCLNLDVLYSILDPGERTLIPHCSLFVAHDLSHTGHVFLPSTAPTTVSGLGTRGLLPAFLSPPSLPTVSRILLVCSILRAPTA